MEITLLGFVFIPVALIASFLFPSRLISLLIVASVFQAGSVVNGAIGPFQFGIPPFYFVAACILIRFLVTKVIQPKQGKLISSVPKQIAIPLLAFWVVAVVSAFVLPIIFTGTSVYSPRLGIDDQYLSPSPLVWGFGNLAQAGFLSLNVFLVFYACKVLRTPDAADSASKTFFFSALIVTGVGIYQHFASGLGWPFPSDLLNSNPGYAQGFTQYAESWQRVSSTFTEPSYAGAFLAAAVAGFLASYLSGRRRLAQIAIMIAALFALAETTATTGYLALTAATGLMAFSFSPFTRRTKLRKLYRSGWISVGLAASICGAILLSNADFLSAATSMTADKTQTLSYIHRVAADVQALDVFAHTYGIGVGLGSNRPSSLIPFLLSTVGVLGTVFFGVMLYGIYKSRPKRYDRTYFYMVFWAFTAFLVGQSVGIPDVSFPIFWVLLLLVVVQINIGLIVLGQSAPTSILAQPA